MMVVAVVMVMVLAGFGRGSGGGHVGSGGGHCGVSGGMAVLLSLHSSLYPVMHLSIHLAIISVNGMLIIHSPF